jgi:hypothetical protein
MTRRLPALVFCIAPLCFAATEADAEPVWLACRGRALSYTPDYSMQLGTSEAFEFRVVFDLSRGRLLSAPVRDASEFEAREAADAVFFFRDAEIAGRGAIEWISINRISGAYAHFIAPLDSRTGGLGAPNLITAADCRHTMEPSASRTFDAASRIGPALHLDLDIVSRDADCVTRDRPLRRRTHDLARANVEPGAVPGTGHLVPRDRAFCQGPALVSAGVVEREELPIHVEQGDPLALDLD